jgi:hypothetical protein
MIRDPTRRFIETIQDLMADKTQQEEIAEVKGDPPKDVGTIIEEIRPILLNAAAMAAELNPSRATCLSWLLDHIHLLDANKLYVLKEVMSGLLGEAEVDQRDESGPTEKTPGAIMADASVNNKDELTDESAKSEGRENS